MSYFLALAHGVLTFISPCILPLLPVFIFYLAGSRDAGRGSVRHLLNTAAFVAGFTIIFTLLGATATFFGNFLNDNLLLFRRISGTVMIVIGLNFLGLIKIGFLNKSRDIDTAKKNISFLSSLVFGATFAFAWSPCLTAFLGNMLILASNQDTVIKGSLLLVVFSLGLGIPFMLTSLLYDRFAAAFGFIRKNYKTIRIVSGLIMISAGILVFLDYIKYLSV